MTSVYDVRLGNSEITQCTPKFLRSDEEILTPTEKKTSTFIQSGLYTFKNISGALPSIILEGKTYAISAAFGLEIGYLAGLAKGYMAKKNNPYSRYSEEWYYWLLTFAAQKPCTRTVSAGANIAISSIIAVASVLWQPDKMAIANGVSNGFTLGYNLGRFTVDAVHYKEEGLPVGVPIESSV